LKIVQTIDSPILITFGLHSRLQAILDPFQLEAELLVLMAKRLAVVGDKAIELVIIKLWFRDAVILPRGKRL